MDIDNILMSNKISSGDRNYKYFDGYLDDYYKIKPLIIMLPETTLYIKRCHFSIEDLQKKYNDIWNEVSNNIDKELDCEPIYNKKIFENQKKPLK